MTGTALELLADLEVGYGPTLLAAAIPTLNGTKVVLHDGFELELSLDQVSCCLARCEELALYLATLTRRVQMEYLTECFESTLHWVIGGPWAADDLDRLMGLSEGD